MKKITRILLLTCAFLTCFYAKSQPGHIKSNSIEGFKGDQFVIIYTIENAPTVKGLQIDIDFDPTKVEILEVVSFNSYDQGLATNNFDDATNFFGSLISTFGAPFDPNGVFFQLRVEIVGETAEGYSGEIEFLAGEPSNGLDFTTDFGLISILETEVELNPIANSYCEGDILSASFTSNRSFDAATTFNLELSDKDGNFGSPLVLATTSNATETNFVDYTFDGSLPEGDNYKLQIRDNLTNQVFAQSPTLSVGKEYNQSLNEQFCSGETFELPWGTEVTSAGEYTHTYTSQYGCDSTITVNLTELSVELDPIDFKVCLNAAPFDFAEGVPAGGIFSVDGTELDGQFDASTYSPGTHTLKYEVDLGGCTGFAEQDFEIVEPTELELTDGEVCLGESLSLTNLAAPSGGDFSGSQVNGTSFAATPGGAGDYTVTYTYTDENSCISEGDLTIEVLALPVVTLADFDPVCLNAEEFVLTGGVPTSGVGVYSGNGIRAGLYFTAEDAGVGEIDIEYTFTDNTTGCSNSATNTIEVLALPELERVNNDEYCLNGGDVVLNEIVTPIGGVFTGDFMTNVSGDYTFSPSSAGIGEHQLTYSFEDLVTGCQNFLDVTIGVIAPPSLSFGNLEDYYCSNTEAVELLGIPANGTFTINGEVGNTLDPSEFTAGEYSVEYDYNLGNCSASISSTFEIKEPEPIEVSASEMPVCEGDTVYIELENDGATNIEFYQIIGGNEVVLNPTSTSIYGFTQSGTYNIRFFDGFCTVEGVPEEMDFYDLPEPIISVEGSGSLCDDETITLSTQEGFSSYQWYFEGSPIMGGTSESIEVDEVGLYSVSVSNENCSAFSEELNLRGSLTAVIVPQSSTSICDGESVVLKAAVASEYSWYKDGELLEDDSLQTLVVKEQGDYYALLKDDADCEVFTNEVEVEVKFVPTVGLDAYGPFTICASNGNVKLKTSEQFALYQWLLNGENIPGQASRILQTGNTGGEYQLKASTGNGCYGVSPKATVLLTGEINAKIEFSPTRYMCDNENDSVTLTATPSGMAYEWSYNGTFLTNEASFVTAEPGLYALTVKVGDCAEDATPRNVYQTQAPAKPEVVTNNGAFSVASDYNTIEWYFNGDIVSTEDSFTPQESGEYQVVVYSVYGCSTASDPISFVGIREFALSELIVFPNPATDHIIIDGNKKTGVLMTIHDALGNKILKKELQTISNRVDVSQLSKGVYFIKIGETDSGRFVKQ